MQYTVAVAINELVKAGTRIIADLGQDDGAVYLANPHGVVEGTCLALKSISEAIATLSEGHDGHPVLRKLELSIARIQRFADFEVAAYDRLH